MHLIVRAGHNQEAHLPEHVPAGVREHDPDGRGLDPLGGDAQLPRPEAGGRRHMGYDAVVRVRSERVPAGASLVDPRARTVHSSCCPRVHSSRVCLGRDTQPEVEAQIRRGTDTVNDVSATTSNHVQAGILTKRKGLIAINP